MLAKVNAGIEQLINNGNDLESLSTLNKYQNLKKKILKTIAVIEANL